MKKKKKKKMRIKKDEQRKDEAFQSFIYQLGQSSSLYIPNLTKKEKKTNQNLFSFFFSSFFLLGRGSLRSFESLHFLFKIFLIEA